MLISPSKFCLRSVKQLGKKSGNTRCIAPNTRTCPIGDSGMRRMITTGMNVIVSLNVRLGEEKKGTPQISIGLLSHQMLATNKNLPQGSNFSWL